MRRDFILNFRRTAGLKSISDEIQIRAIFNLGYTYYVAQWALAMSLGQPNVYYLSRSFITMQNLLKNYLVLLKNLREKNSLLFVMHVLFVCAALLTLLLVLLSSGLRLLV